MSAEIMDIEICNWEKYNPRKDVNNPTWMRLDCEFFDAPEFEGLDHAGKWVTVVLLCKCVRKLGHAKLTKSKLAKLADTTESIVEKTISHLEQVGFCVRARTCAYVHDRENEVTSRARTSTGPTDRQTDETDETDITPTRQAESVAFGPDQLVDIWNEHSGSLAKVKKLSTKRRRTAKARCREEPDPEYWRSVIKRMAASPFCRGEVKDWRASFDFLIQPDTHAKVIEGTYDARGSPGSSKATAPPIWTSDRKGRAKRVDGNLQGLWLDPETHEVWQDGEQLDLEWGWRLDPRLMEKAGMPKPEEASSA